MRMLIALDLDRLIGRADGSLPWRLPGDLKRFKELTWGGKLIVGRKTAEAMPPLKNRTIHVASRHGDALEDLCARHPDAWIAGGGQVYRAALELGVVTEVYATRVMRTSNWDFKSDAFAPEWEHSFTLASVELGTDAGTVYEHWRRA